MKKKNGISLIVLVITILVMIILAGVVIVSLQNDNPINKAKLAKLQDSVSSVRGAISQYTVNAQADIDLDVNDGKFNILTKEEIDTEKYPEYKGYYKLNSYNDGKEKLKKALGVDITSVQGLGKNKIGTFYANQKGDSIFLLEDKNLASTLFDDGETNISNIYEKNGIVYFGKNFIITLDKAQDINESNNLYNINLSHKPGEVINIDGVEIKFENYQQVILNGTTTKQTDLYFTDYNTWRKVLTKNNPNTYLRAVIGGGEVIKEDNKYCSFVVNQVLKNGEIKYLENDLPIDKGRNVQKAIKNHPNLLYLENARIFVSEGVTFKNYKIKLMISEKDLPYEYYYDRPKEPTIDKYKEIKTVTNNFSIKGCEKNIIDLSKVKPYVFFDGKVQGKITNNQDGSITIQRIEGEDRNNKFLALYETNLKPYTTYTIINNSTTNPKGGFLSCYPYSNRVWGEEYIYKRVGNNSIEFKTDSRGKLVIGFYSVNQGKGDSITLTKDFMLLEGSYDKVKNTIPEKYVAREDVLIDLKDNEFLPGDEYILKYNIKENKYYKYLKKNMNKIVYTGNEKWNKLDYDNSTGLNIDLPKDRNHMSLIQGSGYSNYFTYEYNNNVGSVYCATVNINFIMPKGYTVEQWKNLLKEKANSGKPLEIVYRLKEPKLIKIGPATDVDYKYNPIEATIPNINIKYN